MYVASRSNMNMAHAVKDDILELGTRLDGKGNDAKGLLN